MCIYIYIHTQYLHYIYIYIYIHAGAGGGAFPPPAYNLYSAALGNYQDISYGFQLKHHPTSFCGLRPSFVKMVDRYEPISEIRETCLCKWGASN